MRNRMGVILGLGTIVVTTVAQEANLETELRGLIKAEIAFSEASLRNGMRDAFIEFLADDGILFRPEPVAGKEWTRDNPAPKITLSWHPAYADIARSGDLGFTTGPWKAQAPDDRPPRFGTYMSIWRKGADNTWRVELDAGIGHTDPAPLPSDVETPPYRNIPVSKRVGEPLSARAELIDLELAFSAAAREDRAAAYRTYAADDIRYMRSGAWPAVGREAMVAAIGKEGAGGTWNPLAAQVSRDADFGYTYGPVTIPVADSTEAGPVYYVHIWKREPGGTWKLVLDVQ